MKFKQLVDSKDSYLTDQTMADAFLYELDIDELSLPNCSHTLTNVVSVDWDENGVVIDLEVDYHSEPDKSDGEFDSVEYFRFTIARKTGDAEWKPIKDCEVGRELE